MRIFNGFTLVLSSALLLAACSSVKLDEQKRAPIEDRAAKGGASSSATPSGVDPRAVGTISAPKNDPLSDPAGVLAKRSIYFDLDSYIVKEEYQPVVEAHGSYLRTNRERKVILEGHTDERGSREYNLALGQKRAEAVRKALSLLGVADQQMEAISFGEERPKASGGNEAAWAENRRTDIVY